MAESIIGVDEVGVGCWAGPLLVCAFFDDGAGRVPEALRRPVPEGPLPPGWAPFRDSKDLSEKKRNEVADLLRGTRRGDFVLVWREAERIDAEGLWACWDGAVNEAVERLIGRVNMPDRVIIDGSRQPGPGFECVKDADKLFASVCMASVVAKAERDGIMQSLRNDPYGFKNHVGYGTPEHIEALARLGPGPMHRKSFAPVQKVLAERAARAVGSSP